MILCRSLSEDLVEILVGSSKRSLHELRQVLIRRYCGDPGEVLSKRFLHDLVQVLGDPGGMICMILCRSLSEDLVETGPCMRRFDTKILWGSW